VKVVSISSSKPVFAWSDGANNGYYDRGISIHPDGSVSWYVFNKWTITTSGINITDNEWHHVVTYGGINGGKIFIDGIERASIASDGRSNASLDNTITLGSNYGGFFKGSIDEFRLYNRLLSADEIYNLYISNLNKYNQTQWYLYVNQSKNANAGLDDGTYTYSAYARDSSGNANSTETRTVTIQSDITDPTINFTSPTPPNGTTTTNTSIEINVSITEQNLKQIVYNWNGANCTMYNDSLVLMYNFDNITAIGENYTRNQVNGVVDISKYGNNGTLGNATAGTDPTWISSGKNGGAFEFDGTNDFINISDDQSLDMTQAITVMFWIKGSHPPDYSAIPIAHGTYTDSWWFELYSNRLSFWASFEDFGLSGTSAGISISEGSWKHVVGTYDSSDGSQKIYVNGKLHGSDTYSGTIMESSKPIYIGKAHSENGYGKYYFNGSIDEVRIWNRSLSADEVYQQYVSNLNKFNQTQWYLYVNQSKNATAGLDYGTYTYQAFATDTSSNSNSTEQRTITIKSDATDPQINFTTPTPQNGTSQSETNVEVNVSIIEANLEDVIYNWNVTNFTYYNDSLVLMLNLDNVSALGENDTHVVDVSGNGNNGTAESGASYSTSGKYGGAFEFDGVNGHINNSVINLTGTEVTISAWVNVKKFQSASPFISSLAGIEEGTSADTQTALIRFGDSDLDMNLTQFVLADSSGTQRKLNGITPLDTSTWYHVAGTYNGEVMSLYLNGVLDSSDSSLLTGEFQGRGNFHIAMIHEDRYLNGSIDEVRIWNRSLSADEIYQQYVSNLNKFNQTQWYLYVNQSKNATDGLDYGTYTYQAFASDIAGNGNATDERTVTISAETFPCTCGNICVNPSGWWRDGGVFNASGTLIQASIDAAAAGETIYVYNGSYTENVDVNKRLTLRGEGVGVVTVSANSSSDHVFEVTVNYVNISGFNLTGATGSGKAGFYLSGRQHCNIMDNNASGNRYGIYLSSSSNNNTIYNNYFNNTNNAYDSGYNTWNTTSTTGTNIIGGSHLGGNYWSDYAGFDTNGDGLGDILTPYNSLGNITNGGDYHPLVTPGFAAPNITSYAPSISVNDTAGATRTFNITIDQIVNITWHINGISIQDMNTSVTTASYTNTSTEIGVWNVSAVAENANGTDMQEWVWNVTVAPTNVTTSSNDTAYSVGGDPVIVDPYITVTGTCANPDATVGISGGFQSGDVLSGGGGSWDGSKGILTITDATNWTVLQSNLRSVTFNTTSGSISDRIITFTVVDELSDSLYYSETDHYYEFVSDPGIHWTAAKPAAESRSYSGLNGYLATVNSSGENDFISSKLSGEGWMGASDAASENAWCWVTGPEAGTQFWSGTGGGSVVGGCYNNWQSKEPNNHGSGEDYAHFRGDGSWNDYAGTTSVGGYVVEYGGPGFGGNASESSAMDTKTIIITHTCTCGDICVNETGWWSDGGVFNTNATTPIQAAQDNATSGDTICVKDGTYNTSIWISKDRLTFYSENGTANCIISATGDYAFAIAGSTNYVNISGFTVENATKSEWWSAGIIIQGSYCNVSYNLAHDNYIGINIDGGDHNLITYNNASYNSQDGIILCNSTNNTITSSTVSNNQRHGIQLNLSNNTNISSNSIKNNFDHGCYLNGTGNSLYCNNISGNGNSDNDYGIYVWSSNSNSIYDNYFDNTHNAYDNGNNIWNIIPTTGTNIINGSHIGGNYWSDYAGADTTGDGLGDILVPYHNGISNGGDYRPLATSGFATPIITSSVPGSSAAADTVGTPRTFSITIDQSVDVIWYINDTQVQTNDSVSIASYTNQNSVAGYWNVTAVVNNTIGHDIRTWWWCGCQRA